MPTDHVHMEHEKASTNTVGYPSRVQTPDFRRMLDKLGRSSLLLPPLPFAADELAPFISKTTVELHYDKHHRTYLKNTRALMRNSPFGMASLEEIIVRTANDPDRLELFNNAAQAWNHAFYWKSLSSKAPRPAGGLAQAIKQQFGSVGQLKERFVATCAFHFGSGWGWLVRERDKLKILTTPNANVPFVSNRFPLLAIDLWEHAYYLDHQNRRHEYVSGVVNNIFNWEFASERYEAVS